MTHRSIKIGLSLMTVLFSLSLAAIAQDGSAGTSNLASATNAVPRVVNYSGVLSEPNGQPITTLSNVTFTLYENQEGGTALWTESQNVQPNSTGHYSVTLGSTTTAGLPEDVFVNSAARWLGVQVAGQPEQARVLLVAVPYALKAGDAQTIGGLPASAFVLAGSQGAATATSSSSAKPNATKNNSTPANPDVTGKGTVDYIPMWDTTSDIIDSIIYQKSSEIGINTTSPAATLDVDGKVDVRDTLTLYPDGTANTLAINGTSFKVSSTGQVTFISGQTFPGTGDGTITGITTASGSGLSGGGTSGTLSLKVPSAGITNAMLANSKITLNASTAGGLTVPGAMTLGDTYTIGLKSCAANQVLQYSGSVWNCASAGSGTVTSVATGAGLTGGPITGSGTISIPSAGVTNAMLADSSLTVKAGTDLTGGGAVSLGGTTTLNLDTTKVPALGSSNAFTAAQTINGPSSSVSFTVDSSGGLGDPQAELIQNNTSDYARLRLTDSGSTNYWDVAGTVSTAGTGPQLNFWNGGAGLNVLQLFPSYLQANAEFIANNGAGLGDGDGIDVFATNYGVYVNSSAQDGVVSYAAEDAGYFDGGYSGTFSENDTDSDGATAAYGFEFGGTQENMGVYGYAASSAGIGVYGQDVEASNSGSGQGFELGLWGDSGASNAIGVLASADNGWALYALNNSDTAATLYVSNSGTGGTGLVLQAMGSNGQCNSDVNGSLTCSGEVAAVASVNGGAKKVALSAIHSAENWFEDAGSSQLSNGQAVVNIDSLFGETINSNVEYHVFLTPNADCKGLYVAQKSATSFVVKELGGGTSSIAFDYRIMAKRVGFESVRLADKTETMTPHVRALKSTKKAPSAQEIQKRAQERAKRRTLAQVSQSALGQKK